MPRHFGSFLSLFKRWKKPDHRKEVWNSFIGLPYTYRLCSVSTRLRTHFHLSDCHVQYSCVNWQMWIRYREKKTLAMNKNNSMTLYFVQQQKAVMFSLGFHRQRLGTSELELNLVSCYWTLVPLLKCFMNFQGGWWGIG